MPQAIINLQSLIVKREIQIQSVLTCQLTSTYSIAYSNLTHFITNNLSCVKKSVKRTPVYAAVE
jgi:hypothetical protein